MKAARELQALLKASWSTAVMSPPPELAEQLCAAVDKVAAEVGGADWADWQKELQAFSARGPRYRAVMLAKGARLCRGILGVAPQQDDAVVKSLCRLAGIGPKTARKWIDAGFTSVRDVAAHYPRRYLDARAPLAVGELTAGMGPVICAGVMSHADFVRRGRHRWIDAKVADVEDAAKVLQFRWFNAYPSMLKQFAVGNRVVLAANLKDEERLTCANPKLLGDGESGIIPVYSQIQGLSKAVVAKACADAAASADGEGLLPPSLEAALNLPHLDESVRGLHAPPDDLPPAQLKALNGQNSDWHRRVSLELALPIAVAVERRRRDAREMQAVKCQPLGADEVKTWFPYTLTGAQRRCIDVIAKDLASGRAMNRLLQGDVGAGKTAVAFAAARQVMAAGYQVAIMAPTEVLAEQHFATLSRWAKASGNTVGLLTASGPSGVKRSTLALLGAGDIDLIIGTHALISEGVHMPNLGLAIIDEQHRFGAAQRGVLRERGSDEHWPHMLVMTATPIPRTLALTVYGDLDVTTLDEMPAGRKPVLTAIAKGRNRLPQAGRVIKQALQAGEQGFIVCPLIEPSEARAGWANTEVTFDAMKELVGADNVGLCHGRLPLPERNQVIKSFRDGELGLLVATTVIEVGVDVPEARFMVIMDADRFGMAQLHQLRGRVGRDSRQARCLLVASKQPTADGMARLEALQESTDGFYLAECDLVMRGPGEVMGKVQSGVPRMPFGGLTQYLQTIETARGCASQLLDDNPDLSGDEYAALRAAALRAEFLAGEDTG